MSITNAAQSAVKTVADPNAAYESLKPLWNKSRAVCSGERYVKAYDGIIDPVSFSNLLIPFSPSMTQAQYNFYKAEAELPGIVSQFAKLLVGGLLRKKPELSLPDSVPEDAHNWILNEFGQDDAPLGAFMDSALWEEMQTSRAWVYVDYPQVLNAEELVREDFSQLKPYPVLWKAEHIINWTVRQASTGKSILQRVITREFVEAYDQNEFHPTYLEVTKVHELDASGNYQIRIFKRNDPATDVPVVQGRILNQPERNKASFTEEEPIRVLVNGMPLKFIPAWPLNGSIDGLEPMLSPIIDKEIALYNKISRRNHLLYGAATYTPIISSDMSDNDFQEIVSAGLGSWIHLDAGGKADVLKTPTEALQDMDRAIAAGIEEMARLGIRMLSPESDQSGVALQIRNAAQTAQLGTLNSKVTGTMCQIISFMLNWRYNLQLKPSDVQFSLSADFNPMPAGADWLRLATEWYQQGLIPRSVWLAMLKHNDLIAPDYNDEEGRQEITEDQDLLVKKEDSEYASRIAEAEMSTT
jgi:hypothetical protein